MGREGKKAEMEHYILASHGSLACGMKSAVEMICGNEYPLASYDLDHYDTPEEIYAAIETQIQAEPRDEYVIFTDLLGGSVHNCLLRLGQWDNAVVIAGMHLGLVLGMMGGEKEGTLQQRADEAIRMTTPMITAFAKERIQENLIYGEEEEI